MIVYFKVHNMPDALFIMSRVGVTKDGVWIGNWIYYPPTGRNYK
jgi:hypothetical protein